MHLCVNLCVQIHMAGMCQLGNGWKIVLSWRRAERFCAKKWGGAGEEEEEEEEEVVADQWQWRRWWWRWEKNDKSEQKSA